MGHLYYTKLGNKPGYSGFRNAGPFINLYAAKNGDLHQISSTPAPVNYGSNYIWVFNWFTGEQNIKPSSFSIGYAWPVHDGDIGAQLGLKKISRASNIPAIFLLLND